MNKIKVAKELIKLAKNLVALDEEGDGSGFQFYHDQENNEQERLDMAQKQGKKYILHHKEGNLWRIQACKDFRNSSVSVKKGDFGGLVKSEKNLSHDGRCWIGKRGTVEERAVVYEDATVLNGWVTDTARIYGKAVVAGGTVQGCSQVYENARIEDKAVLWGKKKYMDCIQNPQSFSDLDKDPKDYTFGYAKVHGEAIIGGHASVNYEVVDEEIYK